MSYTDSDEDDRDDINEYQDDDSDDWGEEEEKVKLLSKKQKQIIAFKALVREAKEKFNTNAFMEFAAELKKVNDAIISNKWASDTHKMPKFYVKHMLEIYNKIKSLDPKDEENKKEQQALRKLKKNIKKDIKHFKQLQVFEQNSDFWKDEDSDLGQGANDDNDYESDASENGGALYELQDANGATKDTPDKPDETKGGDDEDVPDFDDTDEDEGSDDEDEDSDDDSSWSSISDRGFDDENDEEKGSDDEEEGDDEAKADEGGEKKDWLAGFEIEQLVKMRKRTFWVKKSKKKKKVLSEKEKKRIAKQQALDEAAKGEESVTTPKDKDAKKQKAKREARRLKRSKWSVNKIRDIFTDVLASRGKSAVNRDQVVSRLEELIEQCALHGAEQAKLTVTSVLVSFFFDTASRKTTGMSGSRWRRTRALITNLLKSLSKNVDSYRMSNDADIRLILKDEDEKEQGNDDANLEWMNALQTIDENGTGMKSNSIRPKPFGDKTEDDTGDKQFSSKGGFSVIQINKKKKLDPKYQWIHGNLLSFIKKLTTQLWTNLKSIEPRSEMYDKRRKNCDLLVKTYKYAAHYYNKLGLPETESEIQVLWMSVIHGDYNEKLDQMKHRIDEEKENKQRKRRKREAVLNGDEAQTPNKNKKKKKKLPNLSTEFRGQKILNLPNCAIVSKAKFVFENGSTRNQTHAMLYLIYNMAVHNKYELCRDLLLMSHLGSSSRIGQTNVELQISYNRALAQYAICSFSNGYWYSAMIILQELYASNRIKILLAQDYIKAPLDSATAEQIKQSQLQQARMLPPHFHIHHDVLEAAHLISSLFIEVTNMITNSYNKNLFIRNAYFRKVWHQYLRRDLRVPPENTKDFILTTGINMQNGEYQTCKKMMNRLKLWNEVKHPRYIKKKVFSTLKRECLRCYLYRYGCVYQTISIERLAEMFELTQGHTIQFISKLIITAGNDSRFASLDEMTNCVVMHQIPPMPVQDRKSVV